MHRFHGQFVLHNQSENIYEEWHTSQIGNFRLETESSLPVTPIITADGYSIGLFLGYTISPTNQYAPKVTSVPQTLDLDNAAALENWIYSWRGRYVVVISISGIGTRLYLDAIGSMSCVYSITQQFCSSSTQLQPLHVWDEDLARTYGMPESGKFYPAGMTPFQSIRRVMPNFFLDLETMSTYRHWPQHSFKRPDDTADLITQIQSRLSDNIYTVAQEHGIYLSLTAGRDSRMLLAAARGMLDNIKLFTYDSQRITVDIHIARQIAAKNNLSWRLLPSTLPSAQDLEEWQVNVGHCVAGSIWQHSKDFSQLTSTHMRMPGLGGEIGRSYYWQPYDRSDSIIRAPDLLLRMHLPTDTTSLRNVDDWLASLPSWLDTYDVLDLAYIEHRLGCWAGPSLYGSDPYFLGQLVPFGDRYLIERMLSLPPHYRQKQEMTRDIICEAWPELLSFPFNRYTGIRYHFSRTGMRYHVRRLKRMMQYHTGYPRQRA